MYCNNCGKEINDNSKYCNFCGEFVSLKNEKFDINKPSNIVSEHANPTKIIKCPVCLNSDQIAKVSAVYARGVSGTSSSGRAVSFTTPLNLNESPSISFTPIVMSGISITELSKKLAPPSAPRKKSLGCFGPFIILIGLILTGVVLLVMGATYFKVFRNNLGFATMTTGGKGLVIFLIIAMITCFILMWIGIYFFLKKRQNQINNELNNEMDVYNTCYSKWEKYYYCFRNDVVINPETGDYTLADNMYRFFI